MKKNITYLVSVFIVLAGCVSCSNNLPADFEMLLDVRRAESEAISPTEHIFLEINQSGRCSYIIYETGGTIVHNSEGMISIEDDQILEKGIFNLSSKDLQSIWQQIVESRYFELRDDYRMSIGGAYAFLVVTANSQTHTIDNIGEFLPEIDSIIKQLNHSLPGRYGIEYSRNDLWIIE